MERETGGGRLDEQARKRVEEVVQRELAGETKQLEQLKNRVQQVLAKEGEVELARMSDTIFIGIIWDNEPIGIWF